MDYKFKFGVEWLKSVIERDLFGSRAEVAFEIALSNESFLELAKRVIENSRTKDAVDYSSWIAIFYNSCLEWAKNIIENSSDCDESVMAARRLEDAKLVSLEWYHEILLRNKNIKYFTSV